MGREETGRYRRVKWGVSCSPLPFVGVELVRGPLASIDRRTVRSTKAQMPCCAIQEPCSSSRCPALSDHTQPVPYSRWGRTRPRLPSQGISAASPGAGPVKSSGKLRSTRATGDQAGALRAPSIDWPSAPFYRKHSGRLGAWCSIHTMYPWFHQSPALEKPTATHSHHTARVTHTCPSGSTCTGLPGRM